MVDLRGAQKGFSLILRERHYQRAMLRIARRGHIANADGLRGLSGHR